MNSGVHCVFSFLVFPRFPPWVRRKNAPTTQIAEATNNKMEFRFYASFSISASLD